MTFLLGRMWRQSGQGFVFNFKVSHCYQFDSCQRRRWSGGEGISFQTQGLSLLWFRPLSEAHVRKLIQFVLGLEWFAWCQYNVTEWGIMIICDTVLQWASTIKMHGYSWARSSRTYKYSHAHAYTWNSS